MNDSTSQVIALIIDTWASQNKRVSKFFTQYEDAVYSNAVAPGRNRAVYLLGHLIAVNDGMLPLLGFGPRLFPQLAEPYIEQADSPAAQLLSIAELKGMWEQLNEALTNHFNKLTPEEWLSKHTAVSDADFALNPRRNKLNVLLGRTNHESYHLGQLIFLKA